MTTMLGEFMLRRRIAWGLPSGTRLEELPLWCARQDDAGVNDSPEWRDWTIRETTPDQRRIEDVLERSALRGRALLHVGVGNSSLARRFDGLAVTIDGVTIEENERRHGHGLRVSDYRVITANKYDVQLVRRLSRTYDFIIDNNPTSFCCCRRHLATMLESYAALLKPCGIMLTDRVGLGWTSNLNDCRWGLTVPEWFALAQRFGLAGVTLTDTVVGLRKVSGWRSIVHHGRVLMGRDLPVDDRAPRPRVAARGGS